MIFIMRDGQRQGPYSRDELVAALRDRKVALHDFAWREGEAGMVPVSELLASVPPPSRSGEPAPSAAYLVRIGGEGPQGPYSIPQIRAMRKSGVLPDGALFWEERSHEWRPLKDLLGGRPTAPPRKGALRLAWPASCSASLGGSRLPAGRPW